VHASNHQNKSSHGLVLRALGQFSNLRILDLGCADDVLGAKLRILGHTVTGVDIALNDNGSGTGHFIKFDLDDGLPTALHAIFDVVICADILEHLKNPESTLRELHQAISTDGHILVSVPNFGHWYPRIRSLVGRFDYDKKGILDETHLRFFTKRSFERMARRAGYEVSHLDCTNTPISKLWTGGGRLRFYAIGMFGSLERAVIKLRPQLFAYQFIFQLTPQHSARNIDET
jgi:SAM-dependent methyltransferase